MKLKPGFSLVQTLLVIAISASLSTVVAYTFKNDIKKARDTQRKADFAAVEAALELYYQTNGEYPHEDVSDPVPGVGDGGYWRTSYPASHPDRWIKDLSKYYIANLPRDPIDKFVPPSIFIYMWESVNESGCPPAGQWIAIATDLENENDPDTLKNKDVIWCDGASVQADGWADIAPQWYIKVLKAN